MTGDELGEHVSLPRLYHLDAGSHLCHTGAEKFARVLALADSMLMQSDQCSKSDNIAWQQKHDLQERPGPHTLFTAEIDHSGCRWHTRQCATCSQPNPRALGPTSFTNTSGQQVSGRFACQLHPTQTLLQLQAYTCTSEAPRTQGTYNCGKQGLEARGLRRRTGRIPSHPSATGPS